MAVTLGKRARTQGKLQERPACHVPHSPILDDPSTLASRKRRARFQLTTDENADPNHAGNTQEDYHQNDYAHLDELENPFSSKYTPKNASILAKHVSNDAKVATLPQKCVGDDKSTSAQGKLIILRV